MTASSDSGLPPLVEPQPEMLDAVAEAHRTRGTVMLESDGRSEQWCAACAAVDGAFELRVGEPQRSWRRRTAQARESWLRDRGFAHVVDAWALPVPSTTAVSECAGILTSALVEALGADMTKPLRRVLAQPGVLGDDAPPAEAPHRDHLATALRALAEGGRARVDISGGRPATLWAIVWRLEDEGALLVEPEVAGVPESPDEVWREPLTLDGAAAAAQKLAQRIEAQSQGAQDEPLFITFVETDT